ncbi:MAG: hypothetical protein JRF33_15640 [Deltaproteobacteria bacterium]|nr:hypothetical protein [Deltaproteobacteria bacterium]
MPTIVIKFLSTACFFTCLLAASPSSASGSALLTPADLDAHIQILPKKAFQADVLQRFHSRIEELRGRKDLEAERQGLKEALQLIRIARHIRLTPPATRPIVAGL